MKLINSGTILQTRVKRVGNHPRRWYLVQCDKCGVVRTLRYDRVRDPCLKCDGIQEVK